MREITYYRVSALLPVALPLLAFACVPPGGRASNSIFEVVAIFIFTTGAVGAPVYVPFATVCLWWLRKKPLRTYRTMSRVVPVLFALVYMVALLVFSFSTARETSESAITVFGFLPYVLVTGYAYLALIDIGRRALIFFGLIQVGECAV
jgi:hypothetical protein